MEKSNMKNMVVLRDLPSNIVEEAIVILKPNKKIKKLQKVENQTKSDNKEKVKEKDYILKEAEMLVNSYISNVENRKVSKITDKNFKYTRLKKYAYLVSAISILEFICLIIK